MPAFIVDTGKTKIKTWAPDEEIAVALVASHEGAPRSCCKIFEPRRFNPFAKVSGRTGAPMGRHGDSVDSYAGKSKLYARHCGGDGYYDRGGAYWGHSRVCAVWTRGGAWCAYVESATPEAAIRLVQDAARS